MKEVSRRTILKNLLVGVGIALFGAIPGTFFNTRKSFAEKEDFEGLFNKAKKGNVYKILRKSTLPREDKAAILAVRELGSTEVQEVLQQLGTGKRAAGLSCGNGCGGNCAKSSGFFCGDNCETTPEARGIIDRKGKLGINFADLDISKLKTSLQKAATLARQLYFRYDVEHNGGQIQCVSVTDLVQILKTRVKERIKAYTLLGDNFSNCY